MTMTVDPYAECEEHGGLAAACPVCARVRLPRQREPWSRSFAANYDDDCDGCPNMIRAGELIRIREHPTEDRKERRHDECC